MIDTCAFIIQTTVQPKIVTIAQKVTSIKQITFQPKIVTIAHAFFVSSGKKSNALPLFFPLNHILLLNSFLETVYCRQALLYRHSCRLR